MTMISDSVVDADIEFLRTSLMQISDPTPDLSLGSLSHSDTLLRSDSSPVPLSALDGFSPLSPRPVGAGPGLIRRISHGARTKFPPIRRKSVSTAHRDHTAGPEILRRRSNSTRDLTDRDSDMISPADGPVRSVVLQQGTFLTKVTAKKRKSILVRLDFDAAKIWWDSGTRTSSHCIYIDDIKEIRVQAQAHHDREECRVPEAEARRWFTIVYSDPDKRNGGNTKSIHLIAGDDFLFDAWTEALDGLSRSRLDLMMGLAGLTDASVAVLWSSLASRISRSSGDDSPVIRVDFASVLSFCHGLHILVSEAHLRDLFDRHDAGHTGSLTFTEFSTLLRSLHHRPDIAAIFNQHAGRSGIDADAFLWFLRSSQGVDVDADKTHWMDVFSAHADPTTHAMTLAGFHAFLTSPANGPIATVDPEPILDRPLNDYFISSSHNTYLVGRQVVGESSTEPYIVALERGCRCVEIDCWDGSDGRPVVTHGHTATTAVLFSNVIRVVSQYAFCATDYPLIISLEVHCNPEQQTAMSRMMRQEFGDRLVVAPLPGQPPGVLPSPHALRGRILIKVKAPPSEIAASSNDETDPARTSNIISYLGDLGVYTRGYRFFGFDQPAAATYNHVFSLGELKFDWLCKDKTTTAEVENHNVGHLMRLYPHRLRVASGNFDPLKAWRRGVQMAALNWQTNDANLQINAAMFAGRSDWTGYVLKSAPLQARTRLRLAVTIVSAQQLPRPRGIGSNGSVNPYVEVEVYAADEKADKTRAGTGTGSPTGSPTGGTPSASLNRKRTRTIRNNGFNPAFNDTISFSIETKYPSLVFVRWTVWHAGDTGDGPIATFTAKLANLEPGFRHLPLFNSNGEQFLLSKLFVNIDRSGSDPSWLRGMAVDPKAGQNGE